MTDWISRASVTDLKHQRELALNQSDHFESLIRELHKEYSKGHFSRRDIEEGIESLNVRISKRLQLIRDIDAELARRKAYKSGKDEVGEGLWIKKAIKNPGSLRELAAKSDGLTKQGTIKRVWLTKFAHQKVMPDVARKARLALTLSRLRK